MAVASTLFTTSIIFFFITFNNEVFAKQRVCVIGAGRAGLAAIKTVADRIADFELIAFERNSDVGGLWIYTDSSDLDEHGLPVHSSIYKNLKTNISKGLMMYPDYQESEDGDDDNVYASHEEFLKYLRKYTDHFHLRKYIQFDTLVKKVIPIKCNSHSRKAAWRIDLRNLNTRKDSSTICDAVMVCNGHLSKPNIPKIQGIETFPGRVLHSRSYRRPEDFTNKTVILLGAGASGVDIAIDLSKYAKLVYLSHRHKSDPFSGEKHPSNVQVVSGVVAVNRSKLILQNNSTIIADVFMFCTGYLFDYPFLDERSGIFIEKNKVHPLYDESINLKNPSMAFIGIPEDVIFGGQCYSQSEYFLDLLQGKEQLPSHLQ